MGRKKGGLTSFLIPSFCVFCILLGGCQFFFIDQREAFMQDGLHVRL
jgi:hypothetical protein